MAEPIDKDTRGPVNLRIKFRSESLQQFIERYGVDVSRGGIFIRTREPLPVGTRLKLDFQLVDAAPLFQGEGTVVWIREHDASRAGVTPGMGVRFDRLTAGSQTTLDTILEEKIRLQQAGVAPGSIAKAGAGIAVRRPSGAFATIDPQTARPSGPPPLPVEVKPDTAGAPAMGAAPVSPMAAASSRSGPVAAVGSSSIFTRPRTTSGMRAVPVPSALFEPPTAADIDKALSALEEKGGGPPALPVAPTIISRGESKPIGDDDPTRVFDSSATEEFSAHDAVTGPAHVVPETGVPGVPILAEGGEGELTERRFVDPASGEVKTDARATSAEFGDPGQRDGKVAGKMAETPSAPAASLDAPLASLVDSGAAPAKPPTPPPAIKPAAPTVTGAGGVPVRITTDRAAATESGRFRSDARYKRKRGNGLYWALAVVLIAGGASAAGYQYVKKQREKRAAAAIAAAAAAPPLVAGQTGDLPTTPAPTTAPGTEPAPGAAANPSDNAAPPPGPAQPEAAKPEAVKPEASKPAGAQETITRGDKPDKLDKLDKPDKPDKAAKPDKQDGKPAEAERPRRRRTASVAAEKPPAEKPAEGAGDKKPAGDEAAKPAGESAKTEPEAEKTERPAEAAKPPEAEAAKPAAPPLLKITSTPAGADVVIDGVPVGTTPFSSKEIEPNANHAISVKKDGYESHERMISGSDWSRGRGGAQSLKFNVKLKKTAGDQKAAETGEKKPPDVEILTPSEP